MAKLQQQFEIDDYNLFDEEIEVLILKGELEKEISVPRERFEKWLAGDGRLEWINDYADYAGEHQQDTGTLPVELYFEETSSYQVKSDLYDFIIEKMNYRAFFPESIPGAAYKPVFDAFKKAFNY